MKNTLPITCTFQIVQQGPCHCFDETALSNCFLCKWMQELWNCYRQVACNNFITVQKTSLLKDSQA